MRFLLAILLIFFATEAHALFLTGGGNIASAGGTLIAWGDATQVTSGDGTILTWGN